MQGFSAIDLIAVGIYAMVILALGLWAGRGERNVEDFFLAKRRLSWPLIGLSYYASNMSGASFVGLTAAAYAYGISVYNYEWTATFVLIVFALFMLPAFLRGRISTVPEYLEQRFDARARRAYSAFTIIAVLFIDTAGALYAGGLVVSFGFQSLSLMEASLILGALAGIYTIFGGLRAVVVTDAIQAVLIILGGALVCAVGLDAVGGWDKLMQGLEPDKQRLIRPANDAFMPWPGIFGVILLGFYYWTLNQYFVQRALAARSLDHAQRGALFGGLLKLPNIFIVIVPGLIAFELFPNLGNADLAFPTLAFELLPPGLRGLVLTAVVAAIMSSLDSALNAAASLLTMDFVRPIWPALSQRTLLMLGRVFTAVALIIALVYLPIIREFRTLFDYFQSTLAYVTPPVVAVYLVGLAWPRATARAGFWTLVGGIALGLLLFVANLSGGLAALGLPTMHFTYVALAMFGLSVAALVLISLFSPPSQTQVRDRATISADLRHQSAQKRLAVEASILAILLAGLLWAFW